jgi:RNA polymerase sigma-70 factor, ECF subfamily
MLGCYAEAEDHVQDTLLRAWRARETYSADAPLRHWLLRIATNACLNTLDRRRPRRLPQLEGTASSVQSAFARAEEIEWITPAPDAKLFVSPEDALQAREEIALAFVALLQRLPPKQRAVLLLKDVVGWTSEEIAQALELSVSSVSSALHRARETLASVPRPLAVEPALGVLNDYLRCWEERDLDGLVGRLREDIVFSMPPFINCFRGSEAVRCFLQSPQFAGFWKRGLRALRTRANRLPALVWYAPRPDGQWRPHSIHVVRFEGTQVAEATNFVGSHYLHGFDLPDALSLAQPESLAKP